MKYIIMICLCLIASTSHAIDGYNSYDHTRITIVAGDSLSIGEDLGIYIWKDQKIVAVEVDNIIKRGNDLEFEVTIIKTGKHFFFEIQADDPGINHLPHYDPGLPYPEALSPHAHINHDLLEARGNMLERGNLLESGNQIEQGTQMHQSNLIEQDTRLENEHLLYQGFQPVE